MGHLRMDGVRSTQQMIGVESEYGLSLPELISHCRLMCHVANDLGTWGAP